MWLRYVLFEVILNILIHYSICVAVCSAFILSVRRSGCLLLRQSVTSLVCLYGCLSVRLSGCVSVRLCVSSSVCQSVRLALNLSLDINQSYKIKACGNNSFPAMMKHPLIFCLLPIFFIWKLLTLQVLDLISTHHVVVVITTKEIPKS